MSERVSLVPGSAEIIERNIKRILEYVSPSQIEAFELCPRRWYNASVLGFREEETEPMRRGTAIGKVAEDYYEAGTPPSGPYKELVEVVLPLLGPRKPTVKVEEWVESPTFEGGPKVRGRLDHFDAEIIPRTQGHELHLMRGKPVGVAQPLGPRPLAMLSDIKSKSKATYFHTVESLGQDLQLNAYAVAKVRELKLSELAIQHAYTLTSGKPKGVPVRTIVTPESLQPRWLKTVESVRQMSRWAKAKPADANPLPPNTAACDKYPPLGCPHRARCGFDGQTQGFAGALRQAAAQGETTMATTDGSGLTLVQRLEAEKQRLLGQTPAPSAAPAAAAPQKAPEVAQAAAPGASAAAEDPLVKARRQIAEGTLKLDGSWQVFTKEGADNGWIMRAPTMAEGIVFDEMKNKSATSSASTAAAPAEGGILPEDAPSRTSTPEEVAAANEPKKKGGKKKAAPAADVETEESPGRDPAVDRAAFDKQEAAAPAVVARTSDASGATHPVPQSDELPGQGPVIYIDCFPVKGAHKTQIVHFEEWMAPICEEVARKKGVVDWRLIQYTAKGDLAAEVRGVISTLPPVIHVSKFAPAADVFLECVTPWAQAIIRGI